MRKHGNLGDMRPKSRLGVCVAAIVSTSAIAQTGGAPSPDSHKMGNFDLRDFGAACDGVRDDTKSIQEWLIKAGVGVKLSAPAGICVFTSPLSTGDATQYSIVGSGGYATTFLYKGQSAAADLLTINAPAAKGVAGVELRDFRIRSATTMKGGYALHAYGIHGGFVSNVVLDGIDGSLGNGKLCGGYWFDGAASIEFDNPTAYSTQYCGDGVLVDGKLGGYAGLKIVGGSIGGGFVNGLHMAGGFGGLRCDGANVHQNTYNLLIDDAVVPVLNREFDQGSTCALDEATVSNALINDPLARGGTADFAGWVASSHTGDGIDVRAWRGGDVEIRGDKLYNNCLDGVFVEDPTVHVFIASSVAISRNGNADAGGVGHPCRVPPGRGWGVNASTPKNNIINHAAPFNNAAGALAPNARLGEH